MIFRFFFILLFSSSFSWQNNIEAIAQKQDEILELYGSYKMLQTVQNSINKKYYFDLKNEIFLNISNIVQTKIQNESEFNKIAQTFIKKLDQQSTATKINTVSIFITLLIIIASIMIISAVGFLIVENFLPFFKKLNPFQKAMFFYFLSSLTIIVALFLNNKSKIFVGFSGSLAFGISHVSYRDSEKNKILTQSILFELFSIFFTLAIIFQSQMIGFLSIIFLQFNLGFRMEVFIEGYGFGFESEKSLHSAILSSALLIFFNILIKIKVINLFSFYQYYSDIFDLSIIFCGSFVYYLGFLILSTKDPQKKNFSELKSYYIYNIIMIFSVFISFMLVWISPQFTILRTISGTFFVFYLLSKWIEFTYNKSWAIATIGLGTIIYLTCLVVQSNLFVLVAESH